MKVSPPPAAHRGLVLARGGAVAASQPLAVSAGLRILAQGGSFADAALATSAVLCVVEPSASHLGGDAFALVYDAARRETVALNGSGAAPGGANIAAFADGIPERGVRSSTVPGLVSAWFALHNRWGRLPVAALLGPAIAYARDGFPVGARLARLCAASEALFAARPDFAQGILGGQAVGVQTGDIITQPDLAWTLEQIAQGGEAAFYGGAIADRIVRHAARVGGSHLTHADLLAHHTRVLAPLSTTYRDLTVWGQPPPSQGMILMEELRLIGGFDFATLDAATQAHVMIEAKKIAFADRNRYLRDPDGGSMPLDVLLSEDYAARRRREIDLHTAQPDYPFGNLTREGDDTTYFLAHDADGSAVSFIQSVFHVWGAAEVIEGTAILLNNRLTGFSPDPQSLNALQPGRRPAHTLNAWVATDTQTGGLRYVGGTPGAHIQVQTNLQLLVNLTDRHLDPQAATEAPRWQHLSGDGTLTTASVETGPGTVEIEDRAGDALIAGLRAKGHTVRVIGPWAHGSAVQLSAVLANGTVAVGSDPRCDGQAAGL